MRYTSRKSHYCKRGQMETIEHVLKECSLHPAVWDLLDKISPELDLNILLDPSKGPCSNIVVRRFITVTSMLMICLVRASHWGFTACQYLVSTYWGLRITGSPLCIKLFMKNSSSSNSWTWNMCQHRFLAKPIETKVLKFMPYLHVILFYSFVCSPLM